MLAQQRHEFRIRRPIGQLRLDEVHLPSPYFLLASSSGPGFFMASGVVAFFTASPRRATNS